MTTTKRDYAAEYKRRGPIVRNDPGYTVSARVPEDLWQKIVVDGIANERTVAQTVRLALTRFFESGRS